VAAKPKRKVQRKKVQRTVPVKPKPAAAVPKAKDSKTLGVSVGLRNTAQAKPGDSGSIGSLLIVLALAIAIGCLTIAVIPATAVPWRPAAIFVSDRQVELTVIGFALLMATTFMFFWTRGA